MSELPENNETPVQPETAVECAPGNKKKKFLKIILRIAGIIFAVLVLLVIFRDPLIRIATVKAGSYLTGTQVNLKRFSSTLTGRVSIHGFSIGNPEGFTRNNAVEFQEITVDIDPGSLLTDEIRINEILIRGMNVNYETNFNRSNLGAIQKNLSSAEKTPEPQKKQPEPQKKQPEAKKAAKEQRVLIAKLTADNNSVSVTSSTINQVFTLPLPPFNLTDIGGNSIADTLNELTSLLINAISKAAVDVGGMAGSILSQSGSAVTDAVTATGDAVTKEAGKFGKDIQKQSSKLFKSLKDSFK